MRRFPRFGNPPTPVLLGGERTVTYGALKALKKDAGEKFGIG